jgi:gamma-glutamyl-gamma-aminobutyrate hydrolase PuuD
VKPKVGIIPNRKDKVTENILAKLRQAGAEPVVLPVGEFREPMTKAFRSVQGILLPGGGDFSEGFYENFTPEKRKTLRDVDHKREAAEFLALELAAEKGKPVFGICRGFQAMNVQAGGTLIADVPLELRGAEIPEHRPKKAGELKMPDHDVLFDVDTRLGKMASLTAEAVRENNRIRVRVNNSHHQALGKIGAGLRAVAWADDGIVEAIESAPEAGVYCFGVQFHPERMDNDLARKLFELFVKNLAQR